MFRSRATVFTRPAFITDIDTDTLRKVFADEIAYWDALDASLEHKEIVFVICDLTGGTIVAENGRIPAY